MTALNPELRTPTLRGFTLVEIVITIVLIGIISGIAATIILQGAKTYSTEDIRSDVHYQARLAVERMARDLRMIRQPSEYGTSNYSTFPVPTLGTITNNPADTFRFVDMTGSTVLFSLKGGTTLYRTVSGTDYILAQGVTVLTFTVYNNSVPPPPVQVPTGPNSALGWVIQIDVTDRQGTETLQMRTRVHPRNF